MCAELTIREKPFITPDNKTADALDATLHKLFELFGWSVYGE